MKSISRFSQLHQCPDGKDNSNDKHNHKESKGVDKLISEVTEGGVCDPVSKHLRPSGIVNTGFAVSEDLVSCSVGAVDAVSGFPDHDNTAEETDEADGVEDGHESLVLFSITFKDDEENHHNREDSSGSADNSKISYKIPNIVVPSQHVASLVVGVKSESIAALCTLNQNSSSVVQEHSESLSTFEGVH